MAEQQYLAYGRKKGVFTSISNQKASSTDPISRGELAKPNKLRPLAPTLKVKSMTRIKLTSSPFIGGAQGQEGAFDTTRPQSVMCS